MSITLGARIGPYEVTSLLGEGGMGVVFRAHDTKLQRDIALKLLPDHFANDPERLARFQREARVLAALNHPNIAQIYGLEDSTPQRCIVMELVDGETLQERLSRGPIPVDEALPIAKQIAVALEAAHEKGIIHRDLKPANVKITPDRQVKVLDFGLAKAFDERPESRASDSPTLMSASLPGVILGTAAYMAPEQAKGQTVDRRSDVWAFGAVLYEMLAGLRAFDGDDVTEILGRVVTAEPDWNRLPVGMSPSIQRLLRRALKKDPHQRLGDIQDARIEIDEAMAEPDEGGLEAVPARQLRIAWSLVAVTALALAVLAAVHFREKALEAPEMQVEITTPSTSRPSDFALSPDGRHIVFVASGSGRQQLWLRSLDKSEAQPLAGTEGAASPFWSADSRWIGYFASGKLNRIDSNGGPPQALTNASGPFYGGTWNAEGTILFSPSSPGPIFRIAMSGGDPVAVTRLDVPHQSSHQFPHFLPDGHHFLYVALGTPEGRGLYLGSLDGDAPKRLAATDSSGAFLRPDWIIFRQQTALMAQRLDVKRGTLIGNPVRLADPVGIPSVLGQNGFSASTDGRVAYRAGGRDQVQLTWYDRSGKNLGTAGLPDSKPAYYPELSPDGQRVAFTSNVQQNLDIWIQDLARGGLTRFTFDPANDNVPVWSPDGTRIAFSSLRKGGALYVGPSSRPGGEEVLLERASMERARIPQDWSKDGRFLLYREIDPKTSRDLWALPLTGSDRKQFEVARTPANENNGQFSPDGRWVAYETDESGRFEIVVQPFPEATATWTVSTGGGTQPRWSADGKELYFIAPDGKLMAAPITSTGATFAAGTPTALFPARLAPGGPANKQQYVVSRDGRFLIYQQIEESAAPITLILNWKPPAK